MVIQGGKKFSGAGGRRRRKEVSSSAEFRAEFIQAARHHSSLYKFYTTIQILYIYLYPTTVCICKSNPLQDLRKLHRPLPPLPFQGQQPPMNLPHPVLFTPRLMTLNRRGRFPFFSSWESGSSSRGLISRRCSCQLELFVCFIATLATAATGVVGVDGGSPGG